MLYPASSSPRREGRNDEIPSYLVRLARTPLLTPDEEKELARRAREGDESAKKKLVEANMRLVINIARHYRTRAIPLEDLIQEGAIGLMIAVDKFDPDLGYRFATYATHWIKQTMSRALDFKAKAIRVPGHVSQLLRQIEKERVHLTNQLGREPTTKELADCVGISVKKLLVLSELAQDTVSIDMMTGEDESTNLGSLITDDGVINPESSVILKEVADCLDEILQDLSDHERKVVKMRLGLDDEGKEFLLQDIGVELNLSRERIRQIEAQAMRKLRHFAQRRRLKDMLSF